MPPWKQYNDTAPGAQPGNALALTLTSPDGSQRLVRFDGVEGDYVVDPELLIMDGASSREQALRQSGVLEEVLAADDPARLAELERSATPRGEDKHPDAHTLATKQ
ncbi:hypothetical protein [Sphingomonas sp. 8AM]|uniref:hypothetical protein n=1 Tax=Sphingomonas sp. 8AM TaxID=2653170 RepID=UPI0012F0B71E|nr:hypothetical protein [Sphingomonas sp. 8AM]VXC94083.1 hypothetical protein SPHINGO8AM_40194 [Sphingomonas sp. 8AM]